MGTAKGVLAEGEAYYRVREERQRGRKNHGEQLTLQVDRERKQFW